MKKLLLATLVAVSALAVASQADAFGGRGGCCPRRTARCVTEPACPVTCEPEPCCERTITVTEPARKQCKMDCWWVCPDGTARTEGHGARAVADDIY